jgi:hypothetical protein
VARRRVQKRVGVLHIATVQLDDAAFCVVWFLVW